MIARHEGPDTSRTNVWALLAQALDPSVIAWRQDGNPIQRDGRFIARFVAYVEAGTVRERLDSVVPGEWDLTLTELPIIASSLENDDNRIAFKARLQVLGVIREDVGTGKDYKQASTDAFKRAAVRFGIAHELYDYEQNWVELDGDGKYAKPVEDPAVAYARKMARQTPRTGPSPESKAALNAGQAEDESPAARELKAILADRDLPLTSYNYIQEQLNGDLSENGMKLLVEKARDVLAQTKAAKARWAGKPAEAAPAAAPAPAPAAKAAAALLPDVPGCPKCGGKMWDNRLSKRNPAAPDYKCRDRSCDGVIWPPRGNAASSAAKPGRESAEGPFEGGDRESEWTDEIPF